MRLTRRAFGGAITASALAGTSTAGLAQDHRQGRLHIPRYGAALCSDGTRAILSGGAPMGAGRTETHFHSAKLATVETVSPHTLEQRFVANGLYPRANHAAVWMEDRLWLLGGRTRDGTETRLVSETERIDLGSQAIWTGPDLPVPLIHLSAASFGRSIFVFGGVFRDPADSSRKPVGRVWECAPPHDRWVEREPMHVAVGNASAVVADDRIWLIGGFDQAEAHAVTQVYDPVADRWSMGPPTPIPLSAHGAAGAEGRVFVFGDYTDQSSVLGFDIRTGDWRALDAPFTPRRHVRAVAVGDRIVVAGGNRSSLAPATDAVESFSIGLLNEQFDR